MFLIANWGNHRLQQISININMHISIPHSVCSIVYNCIVLPYRLCFRPISNTSKGLWVDRELHQHPLWCPWIQGFQVVISNHNKIKKFGSSWSKFSGFKFFHPQKLESIWNICENTIWNQRTASMFKMKVMLTIRNAIGKGEICPLCFSLLIEGTIGSKKIQKYQYA